MTHLDGSLVQQPICLTDIVTDGSRLFSVPRAGTGGAWNGNAQQTGFKAKIVCIHPGPFCNRTVSNDRTEVAAQIGAVVRLTHCHEANVPAQRRLVALFDDTGPGRRASMAEAMSAVTQGLMKEVRA